MRRLDAPLDSGRRALRHVEVAVRRGALRRLARGIEVVAAAIDAGAEPGQLDDAVERPQQRPVMADHHRAFLPAAQHAGDGVAPVGVEIVGRLVEQDQVRIGDDERGKRGSGALAAGERGERPVGRDPGEIDRGQRRFEPRCKRPVGLGRVGERAPAGLQTAKAGEGRADAEEIGEGRAVGRLHALAQHGDAARPLDRARLWLRLAGDHAQQRRLADAVAADEAGAVGTEDEIEMFEEWPAVRRGKRDAVQCDDGRERCGHGERPERRKRRGRRHSSRSDPSVSPVARRAIRLTQRTGMQASESPSARNKTHGAGRRVLNAHICRSLRRPWPIWRLFLEF